MPDYTEAQKDYARYRLAKSAEDLESARLLLEHHSGAQTIVHIMQFSTRCVPCLPG